MGKDYRPACPFSNALVVRVVGAVRNGTAMAGASSLEALRELLTTARETLGQIVDDPTVGKLLAAFARIPPQDRGTIAEVLEREAGLRQLTVKSGDLTGVRLDRPNPNAHLYVRTVGATTPAEGAAEHERMVHSSIEAAKRTDVLFQPDFHPRWRRALTEAIANLDGETRARVARLARELLEILAATE